MPGPGDDVCIDGPGALTITVRDTRTVDSIDLEETLAVAAGGELRLAGDGGVSGGGRVKDSGVFRKAGGAGTSVVSAHFDILGGVVDAQSGRLQLTGGGIGDGGHLQASAGSVLEIGPGLSMDLSGTYTGSGPGTVLITSILAGDPNDPPVLDFPEGVLQWAQGNLLGPIVNDGDLTLVGASEKQLYGVLTNNGVINHGGDGLLRIRGDDFFYPDFFLQNNGVYDLQSDADIEVDTHDASPQGPVIINVGTFRKSGGSGTSEVRGAAGNPENFGVANTGTVSVSAGTLAFRKTVEQLTAGKLTGGTWNVVAASTVALELPANVTTNEAQVTLAGNGAAFPSFESLSDNRGVFRLEDGADFATGNLKNSGEISVGAGSRLSVNGGLTMQPGGVLDFEVAGRPDTGLFGQVTASGQAMLDGMLRVSKDPAFTPVEGDFYELMTYAGTSGSFDATEGLAPDFQAVIEATRLLLFTGEPPDVADLEVTEVRGPATATAGETVVLEWEVRNAGTVPAQGPWHDGLTLSNIQTLPQGTEVVQATVAIGEQEVAQSLTLDPGETATFSAQVRVPGAIVGDDYKWTVEANRRHEVAEAATARDNNRHLSDEFVSVDVPELQLGGPALARQFAGEGEPHWFRFQAPAERDVEVSLDLAGSGGVSELYLGAGFMPDRFNFSVRHTPLGAPDVAATAPGNGAETWYVLAYPVSLTSLPQGFSVRADEPPVRLDSAWPGQFSNRGQATLELNGAQLGSDLTYRISGPGGARTATALVREDGSTVHATFDLTGLSPGVYSIQVSGQGGIVAELMNAFQVYGPLSADDRFSINLRTSVLRRGFPTPMWVFYTNVSDRDVKLPFISIQAVNRRSGAPVGELAAVRGGPGGPSITILAPPVLPGSDVLPVDAMGKARIYYTLPADFGFVDEVEFRVYVDTVSDPGFGELPLDWEYMSDTVRPPGVSDSAWEEFIAGERARYGETYSDLFGVLSEQMKDFMADGFMDILYAEGQWFFQFPDPPPGPSTLRVRPEDFEPLLEKFETGGAGNTAVRGVMPDGLGPSIAGPGEPPSGGDGQQDLHIVLVGNPTGGLFGAETDIMAWEQLFTKTFNLPGDSTLQMMTGDVKKSDVTQMLARAQAEADEDDLLVFVNAGHGICNRIRGGTPEGGSFVYKEGYLTSAELNTMLAGETPVFFVADTCHSGAVTGGVTAPNVTAAAAADYAQSVDDFRSLSRVLIPEIQANPHGDLAEAVRRAGEKNWQLSLENMQIEQGEQRVVDAKRGAAFLRPRGVDRSFPLDEAYKRGQELLKTDLAASSGYSRADWSFSRVRIVPMFAVLDDRGVGGIKAADVKTASGGPTRVVQEENKKAPDDTFVARSGSSLDPNEKVGPGGAGAAGYVLPGVPLPYAVFFENDPVLATLPAQTVVITDELDGDLDLDTFELGEIVIGNKVVEVPPGRYAYTATVDLSSEGIDMLVRIEAELDFTTRTVTWTFTSIDPDTGQPTEDPLAGFLPPNTDGRGEGHVSYMVEPLAGLPTGTEIRNDASIVFDFNPPIVTSETLNTIDATRPSSAVGGLPPQSDTSAITVSWAGDDAAPGSGLAHYDVLVSADGGLYGVWLDNTTETSAVFQGLSGHTYAFYSVAVDLAGNREEPPETADATTVAGGPPIVLGDVDCGGGVVSVDALFILRDVAGLPTAAACLDAAGDVNCDGSITAVDALNVLRFVAGLPVTKPPGCAGIGQPL